LDIFAFARRLRDHCIPLNVRFPGESRRRRQKSRRGSISATTDIRNAYEHCERFTRRHYENFPVASLFLPRAERPFVCAVYAFARTADDFADEGESPPESRLARLDEWERMLHAAYEGKADHPVFIALADTAARTGIPRSLFSDLLAAFRMDVRKRRYGTFHELLEYCSYSANPVGRIVLHIFRDGAREHGELSDKICTGLQLANFWQDLSSDWERGRLYLPLEDLGRFGYTENELARGCVTDAYRAMMAHQIRRTRELLRDGGDLVRRAVPALRFELALTVRGGLAILAAIEKRGYDTLHARPVLPRTSKALMVLAAYRDSWK
jgi:squalene synthase HpnC